MTLTRAFLAASASALGLGLAACDSTAPAVEVGKQADRPSAQAAQELAAAKPEPQEAIVKSGPALEDATLTARVKTALLRAPGVGAMKIDVQSSDGVVALYGAVDSATERSNAVQAARSVEGVRAVDDRLVIVKGS